MSEDPRTAALAEAITAAYYGLDRDAQDWERNPDQGRFEWYASADEMAAAILAALPADWCGHGGAFIEAQAMSLRDAGNEIARLRMIEEAAREIVPNWDDDHCFDCHEARPCAHDALRAALEEADR